MVSHNNNTNNILARLDTRAFLKIGILVCGAFLVKFYALHTIGLNAAQSLSLAIFLMSILGTLLFWELRLGVAFIGVAVLLMARVLSLEEMVRFASVDIILFLIGMMIIVGLLKDAGVFNALLSYFIRLRDFSARRLIIAFVLFAALSSCLIDEVTSAILTTTLILEVCDFYEVNPLSYIILGVLATNVGSAGTVLGNPIGIVIAKHSGFTFEDFIKIAFPISLLMLFVITFLFLVLQKKKIAELEQKIKKESDNVFFKRLLDVPMEAGAKKALGLFGAIVLFIGMHHRIELLLGLETNTVLIAAPLIAAGLIIISGKERADKIFENQQSQLWTLFFFLLLFAQAGTLKHTGVTDFIAMRFGETLLRVQGILPSIMLWLSALVSGFLDNMVFVVSMSPAILSLQDAGMPVKALWWAVLFGGCFGGNLTMIGSTANIIALGLLEKQRKDIRITFWSWIKVGFVITIATILCTWLVLLGITALGVI